MKLKGIAHILIIFHSVILMIDYTFFFTRALYYCKICHSDIDDEKLIKKCKCRMCKCEQNFLYKKC